MNFPTYRSDEERESQERHKEKMLRILKLQNLTEAHKYAKTPEDKNRILRKIAELKAEASFERRHIVIPDGDPRERLIEDQRKRLVAERSHNPVTSIVNLKTAQKPKPIARSPILENSRDADYFLESIRMKLDQLHSDIVDVQKQIDSTNVRLDNIFHSINKMKRL